MNHSRWVREPLPPHQEDAARWAAFCASIVDQIEAVRLAEVPERCPVCDCSAHPPAQTRRCSFCGVTKALTAFARNRSQPFGRSYGCKACRRKRDVQRQRQLKLRAVRHSMGLRAS